MSKILVLTSTIAPSRGVFLLKHSDAQQRLKDYIEALNFYSDLVRDGVIDRLVYIDNSGHDLSALTDIATAKGIMDRCEFISFHTPPVPDVNRYYLEINLLKEGFEKSKLISEDSAEIWKVTGRYIIPNISNIIESAPAADLYINLRNRPTYTADFFIVRFSKAVFDAILFDQTDDFKNQRSGEDILRERLDGIAESRAQSGFKIVRRFNVTPRVIGRRGYDGARYEGTAGYFKYIVRSCANKLLPQLWI